jgi:hypothetical protein
MWLMFVLFILDLVFEFAKNNLVFALDPLKFTIQA